MGRDATKAAMVSLDAAALERTQIAKYHTKGGTGFAAEDANNLAVRLRGKDAKVVGQSNDLHGVDRVVDGVLRDSLAIVEARDGRGLAGEHGHIRHAHNREDAR